MKPAAFFILSGTAAWLAALPIALHADTPPDQGARGEVVKLDQFTVTGEKLGRTAQETPTSVAAFTGAEVDDTTDISLFDLFQRTANAYAANGNFSLRGVPNNGFAGLDGAPLASVIVDGANLDNKMVADGALGAWDVGQIEILRGPQSTSQGRNSLAGAVVARTQNPTFSWEARARTTYASEDTYQAAAAFGGPLVPDLLAFRFSVDRQYSDGSLTNVTRGEDDWDKTDLLTLRGKLLLQPARWRGFSALLTYAHTRNDSNTRSYAYGNTDAELRARQSYENTPNDFRSRSHLGSLELNQEFPNGWLLTATTAGTKLHTDSAYDGDRRPDQSLVYGYTYDNRSFSQEVRLLARGATWKAVGGLYYADEKLGNGSSGPFYYTVSSALPKVLLSADTAYRTTTKTTAAFLNSDWHPTRRWTFNTGLRLDREQIDLRSRQDILILEGFSGAYAAYNPLLAAQAAGASTATTGTNTFNTLLPSLGATYHWAADLDTSFTVSRGFRSGGISFNQLRGEVIPYAPEYTWNYELALRSQWLERRVTANLNVFYVDWRDQQVTVRRSANTYDYNTENAGRSTLYGGELELREKLRAGWSLYQTVGYTHTRFDEFLSSAGDYSGHEFPSAPHWTASAGLAYEQPRGWFGTASFSYVGDAFYDPANNDDTRLGHRHLVNAKLGYKTHQWTLYVFGSNLLDDDYYVVKWHEGGIAQYGATFGASRLLGVGTDLRF